MTIFYAQTTSEGTSNFQAVLDWLGSQVNELIHVALIIIVSWVIIRVLSRVMNNILKKTIRKDMYPTDLDRTKRLKTLRSICNAVIRFTVWLVASFMILETFGINTGPLLASAGIIGVALGFGTQSLIKDFVSGLFIIIENQYRVGDYIEVQNVSGTVESISMRTTILRDIDGSVHCVPNGSIIVSSNRTKGAGHTVIDLTIESDADMQTVEDSINAVGKDMMEDKKLATQITEPPHFLRISEFTDKGVTVQISSTTATGKQEEIKSAFLARLQKAFRANHITIVSAVASKPLKK